MADISKIILPNGDKHTIKDSTARSGLNNKVDKVTGKGLSTNDFTDAMESKLTGIAAGAEVNVQSDWNVTDSTSDAFIKNKPTIPTVPSAATATPKMDGTAAVGTSAKYAKEDHVHPSDTSKVSHADYDPSYGIGTGNLIMQGRVDYTRPNRLAFLPADQIIIEQTTDGGTTWVDAGVEDTTKAALFSGVTNGTVNIPLLNNARSTQCGIRITFTAMKYDVPSGTAETNKYQYWNSNHVKSAERYCFLDRLWFWLGSNGDTLRIQLYRANGGTPDKWVTVFNTDFGATGWSGSDWIKFSYGSFGGGTNQTGQPWNYRLTIFSRLSDGKTAFTQTSKQTIYRIYGYGEHCWVAPNSLMQIDHLYSMDVNKNATFPASVTATGGFSGNLTGNASGVTTQGNGTTNTARHVWFSDSGTETKRAHDDDFKYNPATNVLTVGNVDGKINNHTVNADVPADAKFTDTTYTAASATPKMDGTGTVGTSAKYAREDHVHPHDSTKVDKVSGKGLSTNDFTDALETKLNGISEGAEANVQSDWNVTDTTSDAFIKNKPTIPTIPANIVTDANYVHTDNNYTTTEKDKLSGIATGAEANVQSDWSVTDTSSDAFIKNKPTIPTKTGDLTNNSNFVSDASYVHTDNNYTTTEKDKLSGIATGAEANVQSDWNESDTTADSYIQNKPNPYLLETFVPITNGDDLDDYTTPGEYYVSSSSVSVLNSPVSGKAFRLRVEHFPTETFIKQTWSIRVDNASVNPLTYVRFYNDNTQTWDSWTQILTTKQLPISHASSATTYGQGDASNYGHVKLSDTYSSKVSGGDAAGGVAASQNALYNVYNGLRNGTIPAHNFVANSLGGVATDDHGNFYHNGSTAKNDWWAVKANNGTDAFRAYFETGKIMGGGRTLVYAPGDTATFTDFIAAGFISTGSTEFSFSIPCLTTSGVSVKARSIAIGVRHTFGGYPYMCYGSSNNQYVQLSWGKVTLWSNSKASHTNGLKSITITAHESSLRVTMIFTNTIRRYNDTTVLTNNTPVTLDVDLDVQFT